MSLYYLQSRYYDPEICRFINADSTDYLGTSGGFASYNLFAYCENDPVNYSDPKGTWGSSVHRDDTEKWAIICGFNEKEADIIAKSNQNMDNIINHAMWPSNQYIHFNVNSGTRKTDSRIMFALEKFDSAFYLWRIAILEYALDVKSAIYSNKSQFVKNYYLNKAAKNLSDNKKDALTLLGNGLHALQDVEGHGQIGPDIKLIKYRQHLFSHSNMNKFQADNVKYSWTNNKKTHLYEDNSQTRYKRTIKDTREYLNAFLMKRYYLYLHSYYNSPYINSYYYFNYI